MAEYVLLRGRHTESLGGGETNIIHAGDVLELSDADYEAFSDKFEPVKGKSKSKPKAKAESGGPASMLRPPVNVSVPSSTKNLP